MAELSRIRLSGRAPRQLWQYRNAAGNVVFAVGRWDSADGGKEIRPAVWCRWPDGSERWAFQQHPAPRPVYGLDRLESAPGLPVIVVEGEKCADAARDLFPNMVAVTSSGGSNSASKTDWSALKGRRVIIWPDADDAGMKYAETVATILADLGNVDVSIVEATVLASMTASGGMREPEPGWDVADALEEAWEANKLRDVVLRHAKACQGAKGYVSWAEFEMTAAGLYREYERKGDTIQEWICSPFELLGRARDPQGHGWAKWLRWQDPDGRTHTRYVSEAALQGDPASLCATLADEGLQIARAHQRQFAHYLTGCDAQARLTIVRCTGWHLVGPGAVFVLPGETIGAVGAEPVLLDAAV